MKGMDLSGKPGMVQAMQIPPTLGHPPMPRHPAALGDVAIDYRAPAAQLHDALGGSVLEGEISLLVVAGAVATFVDGLSEKPGGAKLVVKRNYRGPFPPPCRPDTAASPSCCQAAPDSQGH